MFDGQVGVYGCQWSLLSQRSGMLRNGQVDLPESDRACISLAEDKTEEKTTASNNSQELKTVAVEAWQSISSNEIQHQGMSVHLRLQDVIGYTGFANKH